MPKINYRDRAVFDFTPADRDEDRLVPKAELQRLLTAQGAKAVRS